MPLGLKEQDRIYHLRNVEHLGMMEIVEQTGHAFETVAKYSQKEGEMTLGPKKFVILKPYFKRIDTILRVKPSVSIKNELLPQLQKEGYPGKLTALKDYVRMRKPMLFKETNPSLIDHIEKTAPEPEIVGNKRILSDDKILLAEHKMKITTWMGDEHPWIPEKEMLTRIQAEGYTGKVTMMGNFMRYIRPILIREFIEKGIMADKFNLCIQEGKVATRILTKHAKQLIQEGSLDPKDLVGLKLKGKIKVHKPKSIEMVAQAATKIPVPPRKNARGYIRIHAFKVLEDGALFETEDQVHSHIEDLKMDKNIDAFTATLPETMTNHEVNMFIKKFARGEGL